MLHRCTNHFIISPLDLMPTPVTSNLTSSPHQRCHPTIYSISQGPPDTWTQDSGRFLSVTRERERALRSRKIGEETSGDFKKTKLESLVLCDYSLSTT